MPNRLLEATPEQVQVWLRFPPRGFRPRGFRPSRFRPGGFRPRAFRPRGFRSSRFRPAGSGQIRRTVLLHPLQETVKPYLIVTKVARPERRRLLI